MHSGLIKDNHRGIELELGKGIGIGDIYRAAAQLGSPLESAWLVIIRERVEHNFVGGKAWVDDVQTPASSVSQPIIRLSALPTTTTVILTGYAPFPDE